MQEFVFKLNASRINNKSTINQYVNNHGWPGMALHTTSPTVRSLQSFWRCISEIWKSFCFVSRPSTKHGFTSIPKTKEQSKHWTLHGECAQYKAKTLVSVGKMLATVFLGSKIYIDCLEKSETSKVLLWRKIGPIWHRTASNWAMYCCPIRFGPVRLIFVSELLKITYTPKG